MTWIGDFRLGDTFDTKFTTVDSTGLPTTLAASPVVSAYPGNSTTELTAGITLSVDFDSRTGMHNVRVVATSGNGYATATNYQLVVTTGTVGGVSIVGYVVAQFSIEARSALMPTTAARTADIDASGGVEVGSFQVGAITAAAFTAGAIDNAAIATDAIGSAELATSAVTEIAAGVWQDAVAGDFTVASSIGKALYVSNVVPGAAGGHFIAGTNAPVTITGSGDALTLTSTGANGAGLNSSGNGSGAGIKGTGGATGPGISGTGTGGAAGISGTGGVTGSGIQGTGGATSGVGILGTAPTSGAGIQGSGGGNGAGFQATGGGTNGDGIKGTAGAGGVDIRGNLTGNVTGNLSGSAGSVTGSVGSVAAGGIVAASFAAGAVDSVALATSAVTKIADGALDRDMGTGTDSGGRTVRNALRVLRNKVDVAAGVVYKEDDTTTAFSFTKTTDAAALPITVVDPT